MQKKIIKQRKNKNYCSKWFTYSCLFALVLVALWAFCVYVLKIQNYTLYFWENLRSRGFSEDNIYATQISSTFIIVSLVSFLSEGGEDVLWENTVRYSLVMPKLFNFISLAAFLVVDLAASTIAFFCNAPNSYFLFFIIDMILLFIMTYKMIGAFFARDAIKGKLERIFSNLSDTEKKNILADLSDKTTTYIVKNQFSKVEENFKFLYETNNIAELVELLCFVSRINENQFWLYVNKYKVVDNSKIRITLRELCISLISNHKNIEMEAQILNLLYGEAGMQYYRDALETYCKGSNLKAINTEHKTEHQGDFERFKSHYSELIDEWVENEINKPFSKYFNENEWFPMDLLLVAYNEKNIQAFETVLSFILSLRRNYEDVFNTYIKENLLKPKEAAEFDYAYQYSNSAIKTKIKVEFITQKDRELIQNMILQKNQSVLLTENNKAMLSELALSTIKYNQ